MNFSQLRLIDVQHRLIKCFCESYAYEQTEAAWTARKVLMYFYQVDASHYPLYLSKKIGALSFLTFPFSDFFLQGFFQTDKSKNAFSESEQIQFIKHLKSLKELYIKKDFKSEHTVDLCYQLFFELIEKGIPIAYILGETQFRDLRLYVNAHTLIPRVDSEILVDACVAYLHKISKTKVRFLELCTGTGALGISVYLECLAKNERLEIEALLTDISEEALQVASQNLKRYALEQQIQLLKSDVFEKVPQTQTFDLIFLNPPYINEADKALMSQSTLLYEPDLALFAPNQGLAFYEKFFHKLIHYLIPGMAVLMEIGFNQSEAIAELFKKNKEIYEKKVQYPMKIVTEIIKDYSEQDRIFAIYFEE